MIRRGFTGRTALVLLWDGLSSPYPLSLLVIGTTSGLVFLRYLSVSYASDFADFPKVGLIFCITTIAWWTIALGARWLTRQFKPAELARVILALATFASGIAVYTIGVNYLGIDLGNGPGISIFQAVAISVIPILLSMTLQLRREQLQALAQLRDQQAQLVQVRAQRTAALSHLAIAIQAVVTDRASSAISGLMQTLQRLQNRQVVSASDLAELSHDMQACSSGVVRELSHGLEFDTIGDLQLETASEARRETRTAARSTLTEKLSSLWEQFRYALATRPFVPIAGPLTLFPQLVANQNRLFEFRLSLFFSVAEVCFLMACSLAAKRFIAPLMPRISMVWRVVIVFAVATTCAAIVAGFIQAVVPDIRFGRFIGLLSFGFAMLTFFWSLILSSYDQRRETLVAVSETLEATVAETNQLRIKETDLRRQVAQVLHGEVQGRLSATALFLSHVAKRLPAGEAPIDDDLRTALARADATLSSTLTSLDDAAKGAQITPSELPTFIDDLCTSWRDVLDVTVTLDTDLIDRLEAEDLALTETAIIAVREFVINAARHGHANQVDLSIRIDNGSLNIRAEDNGTGVSAGPSGLGFGYLEVAGGTWDLRPGPTQGAVATVSFPLTST